MKTKRFIWICAILLVLASSCQKEFNPRDKYKDITIVYGLINPLDSVHYIRIHKAFLTSEDVVVVAQDPSQTNFPVEDIDVRIYEITPAGNSTQISVDTVTINKKEGYFYAPKQMVYYFKKTFDIQKLDNTIKIEVEHKKTGKIVYAETPLVNNFKIAYPGYKYEFHLAPNRIAKCMWNNAKNGKMYDVYYTLYYREGYNIAPSDYWKDSISWHIGSYFAAKTGNGEEQMETFQFNPSAFYGQIQKDITYDTSLWRCPYWDAKITIWGGGEELYYYHKINHPLQDITQERPEYTNLKTKIYSEELEDFKEIENEAFGLFSSRIVQSNIITLSETMITKYLPATDRQFHPVPVIVD